MKFTKKLLSLLLAAAMLFSITAGIDLFTFASTSGNYEYFVYNDIVLLSYNGSESNITIPSTINGYKVTNICDFSYNTNLKSVTIPRGISVIEDSTFEGCKNLTEISIPDSITYIGCDAFKDTAFYNNKNNWTNGLLYLGKHLIDANSKIVSGTCSIKNGTTVISENAFIHCSKITNIVIPDSVKTIGCFAFGECSNLANIKISNNLEYLAGGIFRNCTKLQNIEIPDSVVFIDSGAFYGCSNLTNLVLPTSTTSISWSVFDNCGKLKNLTIMNRKCNIQSKIPTYTVIYGHKGSTAETYAKEHGNKFVTLTELTTPKLNAAVNANGSFRLSWNKVSGAEKYELYIRQADGSYKLMKTTTGTSFTTAAAPYGKQYSYKIRAVKGNSKSAYSNIVNIKNTKKLLAPTAKAVVNNNGTFTLSWNKVSGATRYGVYMLGANGKYSWIKSTNATSWTTGTAQYGKKYTYKVFAVNDYNTSANSAFSKPFSATNNKKLQTPSAKVRVNNNGTFTLSWNKVPGATRYGVYMLDTNGAYKWIKSTASTSWTTGFAQYGKEYTYKVFAVNDKNKSAASNFCSPFSAVNTKKLQAPSAEAIVNPDGTFTLYWNQVPGATRYGIYMLGANGKYSWIKSTSSTYWTTAVAQYGKEYTYKVIAVDDYNTSANSAFSKPFSVTRYY